MKSLRFAIVSALVLVAMLVTAGSAAAQQYPINVASWGQAEINEDGNLRFRVDASASGISWTCCAETDYTQLYLQLWAAISGPNGYTSVLIKSKDAYDATGKAAKSIMGTSARFKLAPGTYTYWVVVVLNTGMSLLNTDVTPPVPATTVQAISAPHPEQGITVTLP